MSLESSPASPPGAPSNPTAAPPRRSSWRGKVLLVLFLLFLVPVLLVVMYLGVVLNVSYSQGDRTGYLQKFSRKGWICRTYEGELAMTTVPGVAPIIWTFSVWDEQVAKAISEFNVLGKRVALHYQEYRGIPTTCFGETGYFVDGVRVMEDIPDRSAPAQPAPAQAAPDRSAPDQPAPDPPS